MNEPSPLATRAFLAMVGYHESRNPPGASRNQFSVDGCDIFISARCAIKQKPKYSRTEVFDLVVIREDSEGFEDVVTLKYGLTERDARIIRDLWGEPPP